MNIPISPLPRRSGTNRRRVFLSCLVAGLLMPVSFACAQTAATTTSPVDANLRTDPQPDIAEFSVWAARYAKGQGVGATAPAVSAATLAQGVRLAESRRAVLSALIQTDPARALADGISDGVRARLPASVLGRLETPFAAVGDLSVDAQSGRREITINGHTYTAHVYGEQLALTSQSGVALRGITLDGEAALAPQVRGGPRHQVVYGNDFFANALPLIGSSGSVFDNNVGATKEPGEPNHAGDAGGASVWYVWTAPNSGQATFSTDDGVDNYTVDTLLAVYTGTNVAALTPIVSNDDFLGYNSQVTFYAEGGVTYHIAVDGYLYTTGPSEGSYTLFYSQQGDPLAPSITSDTTFDVQTSTLFTYAITATNNPTSFSVSGLPAGLSFDATTGVISGSLSTAGRYVVLITATNSHGTGSSRLNIVVGTQLVHIPFFRTEILLPQTPGFYYLHLPRGNIFGYYTYLDDDNFIYHLDLGFEYTFDARDGQSGIYFYDFTSGSYFYTSPSLPFPYLYDFSLNTFLYLYPDPLNPARYNTQGVRYFYNFATGQIITK